MNTKIGKYGIKCDPLNVVSQKNGKKIPRHYKITEFKWKQYT